MVSLKRSKKLNKLFILNNLDFSFNISRSCKYSGASSKPPVLPEGSLEQVDNWHEGQDVHDGAVVGVQRNQVVVPSVQILYGKYYNQVGIAT